MRKANRISKFTICAALMMALIAFVLGSAPFTPALVLAVVALPLAIVCSFFGVWRLSLIAAYWVVAAFLTSPNLRIPYFRIDVLLLVLGAMGVVLSAGLYVSYIRAKTADRLRT